ncbi:MAG: cardiolipin synthase [Saccharofermentanales bacterium]|jgi:cardiolipin synthase
MTSPVIEKRVPDRLFEGILRILILVLAVVAQFVLLVQLIDFLRINAVYIYFFLEILALVQVLILLNQKGINTYSIAWIIVIMVLPVFGELIYLFWGQSGRRSRKGRQLRTIFSRRSLWLRPDPAVCEKLRLRHPDKQRIPTYLVNQGFPVFDKTRSRYYRVGEDQFEDMFQDLEKAERFIFLEYFIVSDGQLWQRLYEILKRKAEAGVDVRLLYDDIGSMFMVPRHLKELLNESGIKVLAYGKAEKNIFRMYVNHRNHQKITSIDGDIGYLGGTNLADEYANIYPKHGHWKDTAIRLEGDAVWSLTVTFLEMWEGESGEREDYNHFRPRRLSAGDGFYQPFSDGPVNNPENPAETVYQQMITQARHYCYITTPYLVVDEVMLKALCVAAEGGIDVRIVVPRVWDHWFVHKVTRSNYKRLIEAGVIIYEYTPGFMHAKMIISDDNQAVIGSINMDYRSFYLHFENGAWICDSPAVTAIKNDIVETFAVSEQHTLEMVNQTPLWDKLLQTFLRLFAPLF